MKIIKDIKTNIIKYSKIYKAVIIGILIVVCILIIWHIKKPKVIIQTKGVSHFTLRKEPIYFAFVRLAGNNLIPLGFEEAALMEEEWEKPLSLELKNTTAKDVLNALTKLDKNYYWEERNGVINVMPRGIKKDETYILNQTIDYLVVNNKTRVEIIQDVIKLLEPRYKEKPLYFEPFPSEMKEEMGIKLKRHNFKFKNKTVREILNEIAKAENIYWGVYYVNMEELGLEKIRLLQFPFPFPRESIPNQE